MSFPHIVYYLLLNSILLFIVEVTETIIIHITVSVFGCIAIGGVDSVDNVINDETCKLNLHLTIFIMEMMSQLL